MQKKVLSEIDLHYGIINMPKKFEINLEKLQEDILSSQLKNKEIPYSREWDKLNTYMREHVNVEYGFTLINKRSWGNVYKPKEISIPLLNIDPIDLKNSADYTFLYGVNVKNCSVRIHYDQNRRAGRSWDIPLKNNSFVMFPSTQMYYLTNNQKDSLNFILTTTYEYI
jgi:hypothetical protein|tara:strand:+ start:901 stop:1404 length:504 start_codon:yes stop_codon:yes gene_type:complete